MRSTAPRNVRQRRQRQDSIDGAAFKSHRSFGRTPDHADYAAWTERNLDEIPDFRALAVSQQIVERSEKRQRQEHCDAVAGGKLNHGLL
jgi:hypothetical protein